ncbi:MAG: Pyrimidine-nucleoside phosphorylase [uncultured Chloroflexia bacterium]|uniref:Pyrimidine-nucleoside phosphorylase n=1 Tax=uncultured Chloroflexia bacterium TaxID=1672391 RepID=A0A6J4NGR8_9CHLR|nr:MAG: Pyrimidine-nucleoside phosphorylase [uncultured Chloroflexia bacterium]
MRAVDIIAKKRDGNALSRAEIRWLIDAYVAGTVPDYQMAAWAMAVLLRGMDDVETAELTMAMAESGEMLDLHDIAPLTVDKHSTGGVGDKTTLVLAPLCASIGLPVAKMSGRALGFGGGTLDKLEAIPNLNIDITPERFREQLRAIGLVVAGQTADLAPADKQLYALRDVTATVDSIPLIAASVMSKKLAAGTDCIILDVKAGRGAFMKTVADAEQLARTMVTIGTTAGRRMAAAITTMEQPLGWAIGNALEIREAIETLHGEGPDDLRELCLVLGSELTVLAGKAATLDEARALLQTALDDGSAFRKWREFVAYQGGDVAVVDDPVLLGTAPYQVSFGAESAGFIEAIDAFALGLVVNELGGGRQRKEDNIDMAVGVVLRRKVGDAVKAGDELLVVHARHREDIERLRERIAGAVTLTPTPVERPPLIFNIIHG